MDNIEIDYDILNSHIIDENINKYKKKDLISKCHELKINYSKSWNIAKFKNAIYNNFKDSKSNESESNESEFNESESKESKSNNSESNESESKGEFKNYIYIFNSAKNLTESEFKIWINKGNNDKGQRQEAIAMILVYSKMFKDLSDYTAYFPYEYSHNELKVISSLDRYFSTENHKKGSSKVDLVLINEKDKEILTFSSKNRDIDIGEYGISEMRDLHSAYYKSYTLRIGIICQDKKEFGKKCRLAKKTSKHLIAKDQYVIDQNDLWRKWKLFTKTYPEMKNLDKSILNLHSEFSLRFGQRIICDQIKKRIQSGALTILNGSDCRFGKSYCMAQDILNSGKNIILFITSQPKTIISIETIFTKYKLFDSYTLYNLNDGGSSKIKNDNTKKIILVSIQTIRGVLSKTLKLDNIDMVIIDEFHESGDTDKTFKVFEQYKLDKCLKIFYSATYTKVRTFYRIPYENIFVWNQEDNQMASILDEESIESLQNKHKIADIREIISEYDIEEVKSYYKKMVSLYFIVSKPSEYCINEFKLINENDETRNHGYSWKSISMLDNNNNFKTPQSIIDYFKLFFGDMKETKCGRYESDMPYTMKIYLDLCNKIGQRTRTIEDYPLIIPIYMGQVSKEGKKDDKKEGDDDSIINTVSIKLRELLQKNCNKFITPLKDYDIKIYNSKTNEITVGKETFEDGFDRLVKTNSDKQGILLLLGTALHTGITNKYCDLIKLNCDIKSFDRFYQTVSRARNEVYNQIKKHAFIIADNYQGVGCLLDIVQYYSKNNESSKDTFTRITRQKLINIAEVDLVNKNIIFHEHSEIYNKIKAHQSVEDDFNRLIENINFNWTTFNPILKYIYDGFNQNKKLAGKLDTLMNSENGLKNGVEETKESKPEDGKPEDGNQEDGKPEDGKPEDGKPEDGKPEDGKKEDDQKYKELVQESLKHITLLLSLFSIRYNGKNLIEMIDWVKNKNAIDDKSILYIIKEQLKISFPTLDGKSKCEDIEKENVDIVWDYVIDFISIEYHRNEVEKLIAEIKDTFRSRVGNIIDLYIQIEKVIKPTIDAKYNNAEILTPLVLAKEMINKIPNELWSGVKKIFEPTCGKGVFLCLSYEKFIDAGLDKKTILEECLHFADLNPVNVYICKFLLDPSDDYELNYHIGDTLELDITEKWGIDKFDLVIGNPPYNKSKDGTLKGGYGGRSLWDLFVVKSLNDWVSENNYLVFVHPPSWRKPEHYLWEVLGKKQLLYLKTFTEETSKKLFGCSTIVDYYVLKNTNIYKETTIDAQDDKTYSIILNDWNFLPSGAFDNIRQILGKNEVLYSRTIYGTDKKNITKLKIDKNTLPVVHNMTKKDGLGFVYSSEDKGHFGVSKVILSFGRHQYPYNDWKGEYGMSQICYGLKINSKEEGDKIVEAINSVKFKEILKYTKWSTFQTDWRMFKEFKPDFWKLFIGKELNHLTKEEEEIS